MPKAPLKDPKVDLKQHDGSKFTHNKHGVELCLNWNAGACDQSKFGPTGCPSQRSHQCMYCFNRHPGWQCKLGGARAKKPPKGKGKGRGKGNR